MKKNITPAGRKSGKVIFLISFFISVLLISSCSKEDMDNPKTSNTGETSELRNLPNAVPGEFNPAGEYPTAPNMPSDALIFIRHDECNGKCQAYTVTVTMSGDVIYTGYTNVSTVGTVRYFVGPTTASKLAEAMVIGGFLALEDRYPYHAASPTTITGLRLGRERPKIVVDFGYQVPEELMEMRRNVELQLGITNLLQTNIEYKDLPALTPSGH